MSGNVTIDGISVPIEGESNLLALCRKANIDIPTFCYHSSLSTYGACRLCLVEINGKEIDASCVVPPKDGMSIRTNTPKIRSMRRMNLELLLANHKQDCPTCDRSESCKLRDLSSRMGIREVRFRKTREDRPLDEGSPSLVRDPNKCILCGDCVRYCAEIQGIGAIDFVGRGSDVVVSPAFGKSLGEVDCVNCGQCAAVCPTAAIVPKSQVDQVWAALDRKEDFVVAQIAPAVRVALGERFGLDPLASGTGKIVTALRRLGFDQVYDTGFAADLTVVEEATEFLGRAGAGDRMPLFTSCCPAWVKFAEQFFPELLPNLSTCMSPQSMMGSIVRETPAVAAAAQGRRIRVVSIMPCTAKKYEISRPELARDGQPLVDWVLTTQELAGMIQEAGLRFAELPATSMDLPLGFSSGAGLVFGNSGGVSEAVARYVAAGPSGTGTGILSFVDETSAGAIRTATLVVEGRTLKILAVQGLANAKTVARQILEGKREADIVEVMACPGGCVGGAGQPIPQDGNTSRRRAAAMADADGAKEIRCTRENPFVQALYAQILGDGPGGQRAHHLLHTHYTSKKRIQDASFSLVKGTGPRKVPVKVCVGTSCFLRGSQALLSDLLKEVESQGLSSLVDVAATFCSERCDKGPTVCVGDQVITKASSDQVLAEIVAQTKALETVG